MTGQPPTNPILSGFNPDPTICRVGSEYFLATSTFEYFPGVPIYHSKDLVNWKIIGHALNRTSQLNMRTVESGGGIWAPLLRYHKGRWYMAVCCVWKFGRRPHLRVKPRGFFVYTDNIWDENAWSEPVPLDVLGIDQDLFFDDDGKVYLCSVMWTTISPVKDRFSTFGCEIDITTGKSLTRPVLLRQSDLINECAEGPHIYKRGNWYYLLTAECGTELHHRAMMFRSKSPLGPYEAPPEGVNPLINNAPDHPTVRQTGHADMFQDEAGKWWAMFLATRPQMVGSGSTSQLGRESFLVPVEWPEDGWPTFNRGKPVDLEVIPGLPNRLSDENWKDEFDSDESSLFQATLQLGWYNLRTPVRPIHSLTDFPGNLTLYGNPYTIDMQESPSILLRKQTAYSGIWSTELQFDPECETEEAGTTVYWSRYSYIALFLRRARVGDTAGSNAKGGSGDMEVVVRWVDEETDETKERSIGTVPPSEPITLTIRARPESYTCEYGVPSTSKSASSRSSVANGVASDSLRLSSKVIQRERLFESPYTGAHFGLFAQDTSLIQSFTAARFRYASFVLEDA